ncbi:MAG: hypothetical protein OEU92_08975 [Alphaproteobacteria bacterium]|nr:hypothetical protein [Alphaproteobacteria bacterium]
MRKATLTAMALALTVAAGAAQATQPHYLPYNSIQGIGDMRMPNVHVHPHTILVNPKLDIVNGVEFGQINDGHMRAIQGLVSAGPKDVTGTAAAIGNTANVDVTGGVLVEGNQKNFGTAKAGLGALVLGASDVDLTAAAIGNATSVASDGDAVVDMNQSNMTYSVEAGLIAGIFTRSRGLGEVETTAAAIGNSLSVEMEARGETLVSSRQGNWADATAINLTAVAGGFDSAEVTSAAIGNVLNVSNVLDD